MPPQFENQTNSMIPPVPSQPLLPPKKSNAFLLTLTALLFLTGAFGVWFFNSIFVQMFPDDSNEVVALIKKDKIFDISTSTQIVGGDKDEHGCLGSAGYSWCVVKNKCLRVWEEKCE